MRLEATPVIFGGKSTFVISNDQLRRFLTREVQQSADCPPLSRESELNSLANYLYCENHMNVGLPRTRESKKAE